MTSVFGQYWICTPTLNALKEISEAHDDGREITVEHSDFSAPEEAFQLVFSYEKGIDF